MRNKSLILPRYKLLAIRGAGTFACRVETHLDPPSCANPRRRHECRRGSLRGCATVAALIACMTVAAQAPPTVFKANANLVIINVSAKDKAGLAVEGLRAEDFTVLEDGKPQKVSVFEYPVSYTHLRAH